MALGFPSPPSLIVLWLLLAPALAAAQVRVQIGTPQPPAGYAPPPAVYAPPPLVQALPSATPGPGGGAPVEVRMTASRPGVLLERLGGTSAFVRSWQNRDGSVGSALQEHQVWQPVCQAPCGERTDSAGFFRIGGEGVHRSRPFMLPQGRPQVTLDARAGDAHRYRAGIALLVIGSAFTAVGLITVPLAESAAAGPSPTGRAFGEVLRFSAYPILLIGLGGLAGGIPLYLFNRTSVTLDGGMRVALGGGAYLTPEGLAF